MADVLCPSCGKSNPEALEICQFCGTLLKNRGTEPLAPIHPGEAPVPKKTAELERTLPAWLRDIRKGDAGGAAAGQPTQGSMPATPSAPPPKAPPKPAAPLAKDESPLDFLAGLSKDNDDEGEVPDWLAGLKSNLSGGPVPSPEPPAVQPQPGAVVPGKQPEATPDWLAGLQGGTPAAAPGPAAPPATSSEFDQGAVAPGQPQAPAAPAAGDNADWMSRLQGQDDAAMRTAQTAPLMSPTPDDFPPIQGLPDWLSGLVGGVDDIPPAGATPPPAPVTPPSVPVPPPPAPAAAPSGPDVAPWATGQEQAVPAAPASPTPAPATPDWLSALVPDAQAGPESSAPIGGTPDWLSAAAPAAPASPETPAAGDDNLDWLSALGPVTAQTAETPPAASGETPDWLAAATPAAPQSSQTPAPSGETPDWLAAVTPAAPQGSQTPAPGGETPDWLSAAAQPGPQGAAPAGAAPASGDLPDWLSGLGTNPPAAAAPSGPATPPEPPAVEAAPAVPAADVPDWMAGLTGSTTPPVPAADVPGSTTPAPEDAGGSNAFSTGSLRELGTLGGTGGLPDWMAALSIGGAAAHPPAQPAASQPPAQPSSPQDTSGAGAFSGLDEGTAAATPAADGAPAGSGNEQNLDAILSMDMPDWLSGFAPTESEPATQPRDKPGAPGANISPADLPSWVQAMRPMESVVAGGAEGGADDQNVEHDGPLAGLRSVLPAQPEGFGLHKPKAYSIKLQVDPAQQTQASLLERLIASEAESQPVALPKRILAIRSLRWAIAGFLLLIIVITSLFPPDMLAPVFPPPSIAPEEVASFHAVISGLPASAPVLVVFDYQPGYSGEMEQAAGPVIDDLKSKKARLALVSTSPLGSLMGTNLMTEHSYDSSQLVDLGYLPGGEAGIQVFVNTPKMLENDLLSGDLWSSAALKGVQKFSDFGGVIVLTDNPDDGRQWIEQTSQVLQANGGAMPPMLMVISAQAEPMIEPYAQSGQVKGMVSGLAGGASYEALTNHSGLASAYWEPYGAGLLAAEFLIVIGGAWALIGNLRARRAEREQTEEDEA